MLCLNHRCRTRGTDGFAINAAVDLAADAAHFVKHSKAVARHLDFTCGIMIPAHRYFPKAQTRKMRQINQFDVKTKPIDLRGFNQGPADTHAKGFESALRVPKRQASRQSHDQIKSAASLFSAPWLMHANQPSIERARSKGQIAFAAADRIDQFR